MLELSILLNVVLAVSIAVIVARAKRTIRYEKLATFAGCLKPLSRSLLSQDHEKRFELASFELAAVVGRTDEVEDDVRFYLSRAAFIRPFRSACLADVGGEYVRLLALQTSGTDDEIGNQIMEYISQPDTDDNGVAVEPKDHFGEEALVAAQLVAERKLLDYYARALDGRNIKIFQKS